MRGCGRVQSDKGYPYRREVMVEFSLIEVVVLKVEGQVVLQLRQVEVVKLIVMHF